MTDTRIVLRTALFLAAALLACVAPWTVPTEASAAGIQVQEATWGETWFPVHSPNGCSTPGFSIQPGNVTQFAAAACDGQSTCTYNAVTQTDLNLNGIYGEFPDDDPAFGCGKDLSVVYTCGTDPTWRVAYTNTDIRVTLTCPSGDTDGDGVLDAQDLCPATATGAAVDGTGCSGAQLVQRSCPASGSYKNHGAYVSCVAKAAGAAVSAGLLTSAEKDAIVSAAGQSTIGKR